MLGVSAVLATTLCEAALRKVHVIDRSDVLDGKEFGQAGPYEKIRAKARFTLDPSLPQNQPIRDLPLAPRNAQGLVEFSADLYVLKPRDPAKGNGSLLLEVSNRGGKSLFSRFQFAKGSFDPAAAEEFGDGWLLEQGYTLVWVGWQWDVPAGDEQLLRLDGPTATQGGASIRGLLRAEFIPGEATIRMPLADRDHIAYPAIPGTARLTERQTVTGDRREIRPDAWKLIDGGTVIEMSWGFHPGRIYECVYESENPRIQGLGLAAVRDTAAFFRNQSDGTTLLGDQRMFIKRTLAFGISQSGRFLRTFLHYGFNQDERGKRVFDGVWADVAGAGRGSFNHRFAQASRDGHPFLNTLYQTDLFPFADNDTTDPETRAVDGLLSRTPAEFRPKIFYTNGSAEYWGRVAALIHVTPDGTQDVALPNETRVYFLAGVQHGPGRFPPGRGDAQHLRVPVDFRPIHRALLERLHAWVKDGTAPPESRYPRIAGGELVWPEDVKFPQWAGVKPPLHPKRAYRMDFGPDFESRGIVTKEPPKVGHSYAVLVPQVDEMGIDLGGIRMPEVAVPTGGFTGWNLRSKETGAAHEIASMTGSYFPLPPEKLNAKYGGREKYAGMVRESAAKLVASGFLLERDKERTEAQAMRLWDWAVAGKDARK
jgi:hypothetical protein